MTACTVLPLLKIVGFLILSRSSLEKCSLGWNKYPVKFTIFFSLQVWRANQREG
jgi:hypothetical protein